MDTLALGGGAVLNQVARALKTVTDAQLAPLGLTSQQAALLLNVRAGSPAQIAARIGTDTAGMTRLLDRLERKGLIRRRPHPDDRRSVLIELTDAGRALIPSLPPVFGRVTTRLFAGFSTDELETLTAMLGRILTNVSEP